MKHFEDILSYILIPKAKIIYSQSGEDLIMSHLFNKLNIQRPNYLDIGANEPKYISNTFRFYQKGCRGILVEPNPYLYKKLIKQRPNDIVLNVGVGFNSEEEVSDFYLFPNHANGLSTFSEKDAKYWKEVGMKGVGKIEYQEVLKIKLIPVNKILEKYFNEDKKINLISIDVEGLDFEILKSIDLNRFKPEIFCIETLEYDSSSKEQKNIKIIDYMNSKGYFTYADTRVNTIFCRNDIF